MRDAFPRFEGLDAVILGVSPDTVADQAAFKAKFDLPFQLLADTDHGVAEQWGVWQEKTYSGKTRMGVVRTTFVIGADGVISHVFENVSPAGHAEELLAVL